MATSLPQRAAVPVGRCAAAAVAWRFKGETRVTAIVKAAFAFSDDGAVRPAPAPPIHREDVHHGQNPTRSIVFASDLAPYKKLADVLFTGQAHAPGGTPVRSMTVRLGVASGARTLVDKSLVVEKEGGFSKLRLLYEHAVVGAQGENPFGEDPDDDPEELHVFDPGDRSRPAGFAPLARAMLARKRLLGALPIPPFGPEAVQLPDGFAFEFFQVAPPDQRTELLRGDERITLEGLHARAPVVRLQLPGVRAAARLFGLSAFGIAEGSALAMYADTLHVSGDDERCLLTFRGTFGVPSEEALGSVLIAAGVETPGEPVVWPDAAELAAAAAAPIETPRPSAATPSSNQTLQLSDDDIEVVSSQAAATLPLTPAAALAAAVAPFQSARAVSEAAASAPAPRVRTAGSGNETLPVPSAAARAPKEAVLPFRPSGSGAPANVPSTWQSRPSRGTAGETLPLPSRRGDAATPVLPFGEEAPDRATLVVPETTEGSAPQVEAGASTVEAPASISPAVERPPAPAEPAKKAASESVTATAKSPWAPAPEAPPPEPARPSGPKKLPPKVDVKKKLYGSNKKGR